MINNNRNLNKLLSPFILFFIKSILQQLFFKSLIFVLLHLQKSELTLLLFTNELPIHIIESPFIVDLLHNVVTVRRRGLKMNFQQLRLNLENVLCIEDDFVKHYIFNLNLKIINNKKGLGSIAFENNLKTNARREMINHVRQQDAFHLLDFQSVTPLDLKDMRYGILFYRLLFFILTFEWNNANMVRHKKNMGVVVVVFEKMFS